MPLPALNDGKVFSNYKAELKSNPIKSKAQTLPFRCYSAASAAASERGNRMRPVL
jgi:hypothetical protein